MIIAGVHKDPKGKKRSKKLKKSAKNPVTGVRNKAVTLAKKIVRTKQKFTCEYCGHYEPNVKTHGSHIYEEGTYRSMAADLDNILCLCYTHHIGGWNAKEPSWHSNPLEMTDWFRDNYPERYTTLKARSREIVTADYDFWKKKLDELTLIMVDIIIPN